MIIRVKQKESGEEKIKRTGRGENERERENEEESKGVVKYLA